MIPLVDGNERTDLLHPVLAARVAALCADPRVAPYLKVESAARTYAEQRYLYDGWRHGLPGFNLAADPDRRISPAYGLTDPRGSWHMEQSDGYAYAVDFNFSQLPSRVQAQLEQIAREYLLVRTVPSEQWHYQMAWGDWWTVPNTEPEDEMTPAQEAKLDALLAETKGVRDDLTLLRRQVSMSSKKPNRTMQEALGAIARKLGV